MKYDSVKGLVKNMFQKKNPVPHQIDIEYDTLVW